MVDRVAFGDVFCINEFIVLHYGAARDLEVKEDNDLSVIARMGLFIIFFINPEIKNDKNSGFDKKAKTHLNAESAK